MPLILYYDPLDKVSFPGEPTINQFGDPLGSNVALGTSMYNVFAGSTGSMDIIANPFGVPIREATISSSTPINKIEYLNGYPAAGFVCCPAPFMGKYMYRITGSIKYTFSHYYKILKGDYNHPNFLYIYQFDNTGSQLKEAGYFLAANRFSYPNTWWRCWGTLTTEPTTNFILLYLFNYEYSVRNYMWLMAPQFEKKDHMTTYIPYSRSYTNALKDISGVYPQIHADLSNCLFDTESRINLYLPNNIIITGSKVDAIMNEGKDYSLESWVRFPGIGNTQDGVNILSRTDGSGGFYSGLILQISGSDNVITARVRYANNTDEDTTSIIVSYNTLYHFVLAVHTGGAQKEMRFYVNGILYQTKPLLYSLLNTSGYPYYIGSDGIVASSMNLGVTKIYNHALTDAEVEQNYKSGLTKHRKL